MANTRELPWLRIFAESSAIVASILLAFWIDAWWEKSKESVLASEYETRITSELHRNLEQLNDQLVHVERNLTAANEAAGFFAAAREPLDSEQLIVDLYNMGRDPPDRFDISTYEDLIATGRLALIRDIRRRQAVQRAYSEIRELEPILRPYRHEYLTGLRGWIPNAVIERIRDICPSLTTAPCLDADIDIDVQTIDDIVRRFASESAVLAYRLREQGLYEKQGRTLQTITAVEEAIALLD